MSASRILAGEASASAFVESLRGLIEDLLEERTGRAILANGGINAAAIQGVLAPSQGGTGGDNGFRDHPHSGLAGEGQKLAAGNTHEGVTLGPSAGAIHWQRAAIEALVAAAPSGATSLAALTDVTITALTAGDVLIYREGKWRNYHADVIGAPANAVTWDNGLATWDGVTATWG